MKNGKKNKPIHTIWHRANFAFGAFPRKNKPENQSPGVLKTAAIGATGAGIAAIGRHVKRAICRSSNIKILC